MVDFTQRPALYMAAGPLGEPPPEERAGLALNQEVLVAHRGRLVKARIRGFCRFQQLGVCLCVTIVDAYHESSYWCPIDEEDLSWARGDVIDEERHAAMLAAAAMEAS